MKIPGFVVAAVELLVIHPSNY